MGSDDLFKENKARSVAALARRKIERAKSPRYLIVCEGSKTEPQYLAEILTAQRISSQRVKVAPNDGNSPDRVVKHAHTLYEEDAKLGDAYDKVFCVFDRDAHPSFAPALQRLQELATDGKPFVGVTSTPCFEFWLLLHFGYSDAPFHAAGKKSVGDQAVAQLKKKPGFAKYGKGMKGVYGLLKDETATATPTRHRVRRPAACGIKVWDPRWQTLGMLLAPDRFATESVTSARSQACQFHDLNCKSAAVRGGRLRGQPGHSNPRIQYIEAGIERPMPPDVPTPGRHPNPAS